MIVKLQRRKGEPWPVGRFRHAACCIGFNSEHPYLVVIGGVNKDKNTLKDVWLFDMSSRKWNEVFKCMLSTPNNYSKLTSCR